MSLWLRRLWIQATSDRRRAGVLGACAILGLLLWARIIIVSNMPRTAVADGAAAPTVLASGNAAGSTASGSDIMARPPRTVQSVELALTPGHDPFVISPQYFPKPTQPLVAPEVAAKSDAELAEDANQARARRFAHLQSLASKLRLEAAMSGSLAVISGKSYRVGDEIAVSEGESTRFVLAEVRQRSVILACEDCQFELKMASP